SMPAGGLSRSCRTQGRPESRPSPRCRVRKELAYVSSRTGDGVTTSLRRPPHGAAYHRIAPSFIGTCRCQQPPPAPAGPGRRGADDPVRPVHRDLERGVVERPRTDQRLPHEVAAARHAHLGGLRQADLDDLAVGVGPDLAQEEVAVLAEARVLTAEQAEHESSVALLCSASSMARVIAADRNGIATAAAHLRAGGLVALPTGSAHGLGAAAGDPRAVARVFAAKGRPRGHPLIVHLGDASALWQWADRDAQAERGADPALVE